MRAVVVGQVVDVKDTTWINNKGEAVESYDVFIRQEGSSLAFGADRVTCKADTRPAVGDDVALIVNFTARISKAGREYLSAFVVGRYEPATPATLTAVS